MDRATKVQFLMDMAYRRQVRREEALRNLIFSQEGASMSRLVLQAQTLWMVLYGLKNRLEIDPYTKLVEDAVDSAQRNAVGNID